MCNVLFVPDRCFFQLIYLRFKWMVIYIQAKIYNTQWSLNDHERYNQIFKSIFCYSFCMHCDIKYDFFYHSLHRFHINPIYIRPLFNSLFCVVRGGIVKGWNIQYIPLINMLDLKYYNDLDCLLKEEKTPTDIRTQ